MRTDEDIKNDILDEIEWDPAVEIEDIGVTVHNGAVTLTGTVSTFPEKYAAELSAKRVKGVVAIAEDIHVKLPGDRSDSDEEIARKIVNVLEWNVSIPDGSVQAEVQRGRVTLTGELDWNYQRRLVENQISPIRGVSGIDNYIQVKPKALKKDIKDKISRALHRHAELESQDVEVKIDGGRVTLEGKVSAFYERRMIENAVWAAPGVTAVIDNIRVG